MDKQIAILILAAGASERLGSAKQLLNYKGQTLLEHTISVAKQAGLGKVVVVLGAQKDKMPKKDTSVKYVMNTQWRLGMGSSIAAGVSQLSNNTSGLIILLCDQPFITAALLRTIAHKGHKTEAIILCDYLVGAGPPSYFPSCYFKELSNLSGDEGAKSVIMNATGLVTKIRFPKGRYDIDTEADLKYL